MSIAFIILIVVLVCWPWISRTVSQMAGRFMAHRAEDMMRRMMGMPSRKEERRQRGGRESADSRGSGAGRRSYAGRANNGGRTHRRPAYSAAELLRSVAVDAEYVEIREFGPSSMNDPERIRSVYEEQVSDVEYTEIRSER